MITQIALAIANVNLTFTLKYEIFLVVISYNICNIVSLNETDVKYVHLNDP